MNNHQRIWTKYFGPIPLDSSGRRMEIHHKDNNHKNNDIDNLYLVTIEEHFRIHLSQGDFGACTLIAKRMALPANYISNIQKGTKRPGIGGVKKGTIPWNKGKSGYTLKCNRKGKRFSSKMKVFDVLKIRNIAKTTNLLKDYEKALTERKDGPKPSYEWFVAKHISKNAYLNMTVLGIYKIITKQVWADV